MKEIYGVVLIITGVLVYCHGRTQINADGLRPARMNAVDFL